jgi:CMP-N,N'-diacetyllegionaminic acid synthase
MIDGKRVVAIIPARAGSKAVKDKNIRLLGGKPLLAWPIDTANATPEIDRVIVSTDGRAIAEVARAHGAEVYARPAELATDGALVIDAVRDLIARLRHEGESAECLVLLEATCPFRQPDDVSRCLRILTGEDRDSVATFTEPSLNPWRAWRIDEGVPRPFIDGAMPFLPRQKLPSAAQLNGAVYAVRADRLPADGISLLFGRMGAVEMPRERSIDIDDALDFAYAEALLKQSKHVQAGDALA